MLHPISLTHFLFLFTELDLISHILFVDYRSSRISWGGNECVCGCSLLAFCMQFNRPTSTFTEPSAGWRSLRPFQKAWLIWQSTWVIWTSVSETPVTIMSMSCLVAPVPRGLNNTNYIKVTCLICLTLPSYDAGIHLTLGLIVIDHHHDSNCIIIHKHHIEEPVKPQHHH